MTRLQARDPMTRVCAWCQCVIGSDNQPTPHRWHGQPGADVTHGICESCKAKHFRLPRRTRELACGCVVDERTGETVHACGRRVHDDLRCAHCGRPIEPDAAGYCMHCGLAQLPETDLAAVAALA